MLFCPWRFKDVKAASLKFSSDFIQDESNIELYNVTMTVECSLYVNPSHPDQEYHNNPMYWDGQT